MAACKKDCNDETRDSVRYILSKNVVCGNALTMMCVDANQEDTAEYFASFFTLSSVRARISERKFPSPQAGSIKTLTLIQTEKAFSGT